MDYFLFNFSGVQFHYTMSQKYIIYTVYGKRKAPAANAADAKGKTDLISTEELQLLHAFFRSCQPAELQQHRL